MVNYTKMSKVEQVNAARENGEKIRQIQKELEGVENKRKQRQQEYEIERRVEAKMKEIGKQLFDKQSNQSK